MAERVDRALERVTASCSFAAEEQVWLYRIREPLNANLSIELEDFDEAPSCTIPAAGAARTGHSAAT